MFSSDRIGLTCLISVLILKKFKKKNCFLKVFSLNLVYSWKILPGVQFHNLIIATNVWSVALPVPECLVLKGFLLWNWNTVDKFYLVRNFMIHNHRHQLLVSSASCYRVKKHSGLTKCYYAPVFHSAAHVRNCNQIWNIGRAIFLKLIGETAALPWSYKLKSLDSRKVQEYHSCSKSNGLECCNFHAI